MCTRSRGSEGFGDARRRGGCMRVVIRGAIVALLFVSGSLFAQNSTYRPDPNWKAPVAEAAKKNPLAKTQVRPRRDADCSKLSAQCATAWTGVAWPTPRTSATPPYSASPTALYSGRSVAVIRTRECHRSKICPKLSGGNWSATFEHSEQNAAPNEVVCLKFTTLPVLTRRSSTAPFVASSRSPL